MKSLKVDFKIDIPIYNGVRDAEQLDGWMDMLVIYFFFFGINTNFHLHQKIFHHGKNLAQSLPPKTKRGN